MEEQRINRRLNILALGLFALGLLLFVLGEANVIPIGLLPPCYAVQVAVSLTTVSAIPVALKWMAFGAIRRRVVANFPAYACWASARLLVLGVPMLGAGLAYYLMLDPSMMYCALLLALAFLFVWPSQGRQERETAAEGKEDTEA